MPSARYKEAVATIEQMWRDSGASSTCQKCIAAGQGCCHGCGNLGATGCTDKHLPCALWTCYKIDRQHPLLAAKMKQLANGLGLRGVFGRNMIEVVPYTGQIRKEHQFDAPAYRSQLVQIRGLCG